MKETINNLINRPMLPRMIFGGMLSLYTLLIFIILYLVYVRESPINTYLSWPVSDWMINYEGGFVRRGLCGQLLYWLYQWHPYPLRDTIVLIALAGSILFIVCVVRMFIREGWSLFLLITPFLIFFPMFGSNELFWHRRDHWLLLLAYAIFLAYSRIIRHNNFRYLCALWLLSVVVILMHEATFFFIFPILMLHRYASLRQEGKSSAFVLKDSLILFTPAVAAMGLACVFKGDRHVAQTIWESWYPCMEAYPLPGDFNKTIGAGVEALTWTTESTIMFHLKLNFWKWFFPGIPRVLIVLLNYTGVYYLATRLNQVSLSWNRLQSINHISLSNVLLLQFLSMLPLFTVLSCDTSRLMAYWVFSSLFFYHFMKSNTRCFPALLTKFSAAAQTKIQKSDFLMHPLTYLAIALFLPVGLTTAVWSGTLWGELAVWGYRALKYIF